MTFCIVGRGRIGQALHKVSNSFPLMSARQDGYEKLVAASAADGFKVLIAARDRTASPLANIALLDSISRDLISAGVPTESILHCGSYAVGNPHESNYQIEKQVLEQLVRAGTLPGHVLRLPR